MDASSYHSTDSSSRLCERRSNAVRQSVPWHRAKRYRRAETRCIFVCVFDFILGVEIKDIKQWHCCYFYNCTLIICAIPSCTSTPSLCSSESIIAWTVSKAFFFSASNTSSASSARNGDSLALHVSWSFITDICAAYIRHALWRIKCRNSYQRSVACRHSTLLWTRTLQTMSRRRPRGTTRRMTDSREVE